MPSRAKSSTHLALGEGDQARLHFYLSAPGERLRAVRAVDLEITTRQLIRPWPDRLREGLEEVRPPDEARLLARRYGEAFSPEYRAATAPASAIRDILELEKMVAADRSLAIALENRFATPPPEGAELASELKLYIRDQRLILSDFMPILENAGLRVIAVSPFEVEGVGLGKALIFAFEVQNSNGRPLDVDAKGDLLAETILGGWVNRCVNVSGGILPLLG